MQPIIFIGDSLLHRGIYGKYDDERADRELDDDQFVWTLKPGAKASDAEWLLESMLQDLGISNQRLNVVCALGYNNHRNYVEVIEHMRRLKDNPLVRNLIMVVPPKSHEAYLNYQDFPESKATRIQHDKYKEMAMLKYHSYSFYYTLRKYYRVVTIDIL